MIMTTVRSLCLTWLVAALLLPGESLIQGSSSARNANRIPRLAFLKSTQQQQQQRSSKATTAMKATTPPQAEPVDMTQGAKNRLIVSSELEVDIPIDVAYRAFSDLPRQPSWSPWLRSVTYDEANPEETIWKMRYLGFTISWRAVSTNLEPPNVIEWKSIQGLKNFGRVDFTELPNDSTHMKLTLAFELPRFAARMMGKTGRITRIVENRMLKTTLQNFRDIVVANDLKRGITVEPTTKTED